VILLVRICFDYLTVAKESQHLDTLLEKAKLGRKISDGKNEISHKFFGRKI